MANNKDFKVKNGIQPTVYHEGVGTVVSGSEGYSLAGASYDGVSFSVASQDATMNALEFKPDGTKLYTIGHTSDSIHQYSLSTAWDLSTASYDSVTLSVASQASVPMDLSFNSDGTKVIIVGFSTNAIYQYSLGTAYDISTGSYDSVSFSLASQLTSPRCCTFGDSGSKLYVAANNGSIFQYSMSTAYDVSTLSYDSKSFDPSGQDGDPKDVKFNSDGTKAFITGDSTNTIYQYTLSTAWDISTASYDSVSFGVGSQDVSPFSIVFGNNAQKMFLLGGNADTIYQYSTVLTTATLDLSTGSVFEITPTSDIQINLSNPAASGTVSAATLLLDQAGYGGYDLSSASYSGKSFSIAGQESVPTGLFFKPDGLKMYVVGSNGDEVNEYSLSTEWDVLTASYLQTFSIAGQDTAPEDIFFKPDGTKMYIAGNVGDDINEYDLSTAWDISTASYLQGFSITAQDTQIRGLFFKPDGTKMYIAGNDGDDINEYSLSTAWNVSTASYVQAFSVAGQDTSPQAVSFKSDGTKMYVLGGSGVDVNEYTLSTAWNISTASYVQAFSVSSEEAVPLGLFLKPDGASMYIVGNISDTIYQYSTATPATITYPSTLEWPSGTAPTSPAIGETDVLTFSTTDGGTTYQAVQAIDGAA